MSRITTGIKGELPVSEGSEIEVCICERRGRVWYLAVLEENLEKLITLKRRKVSVRHLTLSKDYYSPPLFKTAFRYQIRPVPPFLDVDFEEGDHIDVAHKGGWCDAWVIRVMGNLRYLVYRMVEPDVIVVDRTELRPYFCWKSQEWFRCGKIKKWTRRVGKNVQVRTDVEHLGDVWAPAMSLKENDDGTVRVKFTSLVERVNKIQFDDPVSAVNKIIEGFLQLEKHGFTVTEPLSRIGKLQSAKASQTQALEELKVVDRELSEEDNKRSKCEEDIEDLAKTITVLQRQEVLLRESKVAMDREIARMQSHAADLYQKVENAELEFQAIVAAPWN